MSVEISKIEKVERDDIDVYSVTLVNGNSIDFEASSEDDARSKAEAFMSEESNFETINTVSTLEESESEES